MRKKSTSPKVFRELLKEITFYLGYEATSTLATKAVEIETPVASTTGKQLSEKVALIPILRSGLGMVDAMLQVLPSATVHHIGMYRDKASLMPIVYYTKLPQECTVDTAVVLEPCIATAGSINAAIGILKDWGVAKVVVISIIATQEGLDNLHRTHPDVTVHCAAVDECYEKGFIMPGFGDVGDRQFSTGRSQEEASAASKKRKLEGE